MVFPRLAKSRAGKSSEPLPMVIDDELPMH